VGYWLVGEDGAVYAFGNAQYVGSVPQDVADEGLPPTHAIVGVALSD
jgi:hypothetical protein